jgi:hypothetical protein
MALIQFNITTINKDQQGRQQSPRDYLADKSGSQSPSIANNVRLNTANSTNSTSLNNSNNNASRSQQQPVVANSSGKSNEKEIQIQRVSSSPSNNNNNNNNNNDLLVNNISKQKLSGDSPTSSPTSGNKVVNYIDIQVVNSKSSQNNNNPAVSSPTLNNQSQQLDLSNSSKIKSPFAANTNIQLQQQPSSLTVNKQVQQQIIQRPKVNLNIPAFHFPTGRPESRQFKSCEDVEAMKAIAAKFKASKEGGKILRDEFGEIVKMLDLPLYWKTLVFRACTLNSKFNYVTYPILEQVWTK